MQPGQTINPNNGQEPILPPPVVELPQPVNPTPPPAPTTTTPAPTVAAPTPTPASPIQETAQAPKEAAPAWQYTADEAQPNQTAPQAEAPVSWTASEFIDHDKRATWFVGLAIVAILGAGLVYLITRDFIAPVVILIAAALFGVTGGRKPQTLGYGLDGGGITIGPKHYGYDQFKSFSVIEEGAIDSIQLTPLARLAPPISLYYPPDQEDQIVGMLANYLPHEDRTHDPVDRLMRRIRF